MTLGLFNSFFDFVFQKKNVILRGGQLLPKNESQELLWLLFHGETNAEKIRVQEILRLLLRWGDGLCCLRGGGTSAEKIRVQEIVGLCFKKLVILRGGPVNKITLYD